MGSKNEVTTRPFKCLWIVKFYEQSSRGKYRRAWWARFTTCLGILCARKLFSIFRYNCCISTL